MDSSPNFRHSPPSVHVLPREHHQENGDALRDSVLAQTHRWGQLFGRHGDWKPWAQLCVRCRHHRSQLHGKGWVWKHRGMSLFCHSHFRWVDIIRSKSLTCFSLCTGQQHYSAYILSSLVVFDDHFNPWKLCKHGLVGGKRNKTIFTMPTQWNCFLFFHFQGLVAITHTFSQAAL